MSTRASPRKLNKKQAQCHHCGGWFTTQGLPGHIHWRHPFGGEPDELVEQRLRTERTKLELFETVRGNLDRGGEKDTLELAFKLFLREWLSESISKKERSIKRLQAAVDARRHERFEQRLRELSSL